MTLRATLVPLLAAGCIGGADPAQCAIDSDCVQPAFCAAGACIGGTRTCPSLQPTFASINSRFIQVGCGVRQLNCHSSDSPAVESGPTFAGHPYGALVNAPALNRLGTVQGLVLVTPGDPAHSFLLTKLRLTATHDPAFGGGQPASAPGSTCAESLAVIEEWIQRGAQDN
jgi:hypothetical protein